MRYAMALEYDGSPFMGWQKHQTGPTIQTAVEQALSYVADVLNKNIRRTDLLARWSEDTLVLLFTETKLAASKKALQKLLEQCEQDQEECSLSWTLSWSCANIHKDEVDKTVEAAQARLQPWQDTQPGLLTEDGEGEGELQVGGGERRFACTAHHHIAYF